MNHFVCCGRSEREQSKRLCRDTEAWAGDGETSDAEHASNGSWQHEGKTRGTLIFYAALAFLQLSVLNTCRWFHMRRFV